MITKGHKVLMENSVVQTSVMSMEEKNCCLAVLVSIVMIMKEPQMTY